MGEIETDSIFIFQFWICTLPLHYVHNDHGDIVPVYNSNKHLVVVWQNRITGKLFYSFTQCVLHIHYIRLCSLVTCLDKRCSVL